MSDTRGIDPRAVHAIVLAGGTGERLGRRSKADVELAGRRLLDLVLEGLAPVVDGTVVVVAPSSVRVPERVVRTLEDPPLGGPLAGIGAGLAVIAAARRARVRDARPSTGDEGARGTSTMPDGDLVVVCSVDTPGIGVLAPRLVAALAAAAPWDGAAIVGGAPEPFRQYLQAVYRLEALSEALERAGRLRHRGVTRALSVLDLLDVPASADECRDVDTPADIAWWTARLGGSAPADG